MQVAFICIVFLLELYFLGYKIRLNLEKTAFIVLTTQLLIMVMRILLGLFNKVYIIEPIILVCSYSVVHATLYYFIFEMKLVALKI
jgi:hypothetical protein